MRKVMMIGTLALLFCGYWAPTTAAQQSIKGDWVGGFKIRDQYRFIRVHFMMDGKGLKASSDILFPLSERSMNLAIAQVSSQPSQLHFELPGDAAAFTFDGEFKDGTISGEVRQAGECSAFHLTRIAKVEPKILDEYSGVYFEVARTGEGWEQLAADAQQARAKKWFEYHGLPSSLDRLQWSWKNVWSYDPALFFENTTCPVLVLLGGMDPDVPTKESVPRIEQALKKGGNKDYVIKVFPKGSHSLLEMNTGNHAKDLCCIKGFSPGYFETMTNWILKRVDVGK